MPPTGITTLDDGAKAEGFSRTATLLEHIYINICSMVVKLNIIISDRYSAVIRPPVSCDRVTGASRTRRLSHSPLAAQSPMHHSA